MPANVTNQDYTQQINQAFNALKFATPQQLALVSQQVQQNPQSPEAMALAMATQYQQEMRQPRPAAPQGTVLQQKLAQLQAANAAPAGLPVVGGNQMALNQAVAQDPMRGAGIAVAPENTPDQEQRATGGIVALAQGGEVRGFAGGGDLDLGDFASAPISGMPTQQTGITGIFDRFASSPAAQSIKHWATTPGVLAPTKSGPAESIQSPTWTHAEQTPELGTQRFPEEEAEEESKDEAAIKEPVARAAAQHADKKISKPEHETIHPPAPGSSAEQIAQKAEEDKVMGNYANAEDLKAGLKSFFPSAYQASPELQDQMKKDLSTAKRDTIMSSLAQGLGAMLSSRSSKTGSIGEGLMQAASAYEKGSDVEQGLQDRLTNLQMVHEKALQEGDKEVAQTALNMYMKNKDALTATKAKQAELAYERGTKLATGQQSGQFDLAKVGMQGENAKDLQYLENKGAVDLQQIKQMAEQQGLYLTGAQGNTIMSGLNQEAAEAAKLGTPWDANTWNTKLAERFSGARSALSGRTPAGTGTPNPLQPVGGMSGAYITSP